ncbi:MAG: MBL fold metallo-hydrolase [Saprospiraceae bacterium]
MHIQCFTTNPFFENSYLIWDDNLQGIIIDPGFYTPEEEHSFLDFVNNKGIQMKDCWLTHAHIDHIFGCNFIYKQYGIKPRMHANEEFIYQSANQVLTMYGLNNFEFPSLGEFIHEAEELRLGKHLFATLFTPGHSPGSSSFYCEEQNLIFSGDVLFEGSIGRTDLPGGDHNTLINSIKFSLMHLPNSTVVYSGHGGLTSIGQEKLTNPFL